MPRTQNTVVENNFIKGLITEATSLNFPENACYETYNCVFDFKGEVKRRYGLDFEVDYDTQLVDVGAFTLYYWHNAAGISDANFLVVQAGSSLYIYTINDTDSISATAPEVVDLTAGGVGTDAQVAASDCQYAQGIGYLFVVNPYCEPQYVSYDSGTGTFSISTIDLLVRDTEGVDDTYGLQFDFRPSTLTDAHKYNLYNQSFAPIATVDYINTWRGSGTLIMPDAIISGRTSADYPSNADIWWIYKNADDNFDINLIDKNQRGNTPAPKGHYVYNAFLSDRSTQSGITGLTEFTSDINRPSTVAFYAGRVWYAGVDYQNYSSKLYFSQVAKTEDYFGLCYQQNDPTNEYTFSLLATDGGSVNVQECGKIIKLFASNTSLFIFATNGIWSVTGNQGISFSPEDFSVRKVSSIPSISGTSFVDVEGLPMWWNNDGIYYISGNNSVGSIQVDNLTNKSIKTFYRDIPVLNKHHAQGNYNYQTKEVIWVYRSYASTTSSTDHEFDRALILNMMTNAFFPWTFPNEDVKVHGVYALRATSTELRTTYTVDTNGHYVLDSHNEPTTTRGLSTDLKASTFKFVVSSFSDPQRDMTIAELSNDDYIDFYTFDTTGVNFESYLITGFKMAGQANKAFQSNYLTVYMKNEDSPEVFFQGKWSFSTSVTSGYNGTRQHIQFPEEQETGYFNKKLKVRGNGNVLQFKFSSVDGKPFNISGWSRFDTANQVP